VKPLEGIRVVEAATLFAAPIAGMLLGDYGADVIKVEHPRRPDPARGHGPSKDDVGLWFKTLGRNKRLVTLDLSQPDGRDLFLRLAERSDVVLENFRPGTLERWGLGWDELSAVNPRLVLARVSGFGQTGPYAGRSPAARRCCRPSHSPTASPRWRPRSRSWSRCVRARRRGEAKSSTRRWSSRC
jgi:crotonobetainyl-CoA:carnitine CoA-transferase CaiB-like acyl-CoA transferase